MKRRDQKGLAVLVSILLLMIISVMGFIASNKGIFIQKFSAVKTRNNELAVAAEVAMRNAIQSIYRSKVAIGKSRTGVSSDTWLETVWDPSSLAAIFNQNSGRTNFTNFEDPAWDNINNGNALVSNLNTSSGQIITKTIIEEIAIRTWAGPESSKWYEAQYLVTVRAAAINPGVVGVGVEDDTQTYIIQAVTGRNYNSEIPDLM